MTSKMTSTNMIWRIYRLITCHGDHFHLFCIFLIQPICILLVYRLSYSRTMAPSKHLQEAFSRLLKNRGNGGSLLSVPSPGIAPRYVSKTTGGVWWDAWEHGEEKGVEEVLGLKSPGRGRGGGAVDFGYGAFSHPCRQRVSFSLRFPVTPKRALAVR